MDGFNQKFGLTGLFYVRGAVPKDSLIGLTQDKMTIFGHMILTIGVC